MTSPADDEQAAAPSPQEGRIPGLDGVRGLACLGVMAAHSIGFTTPTGHSYQLASLAAESVVAFFVLSGFLILLPFQRAAVGLGPRPSLARYASLRLRRVYPAYLVVFLVANLLGVVYVANAVTGAIPGTTVGTGHIVDPIRLVEHLTLVQNLIPGQLQTGLNVSWSLTTELCFYLVVPLLGLMAMGRRHSGLGRLLAPGLLMLAVGVVSKVLLQVHQHVTDLGQGQAMFGPTWHAVVTRGLLGQADAFAPGMIVVALYVEMGRGGLPAWTGRRLRAGCLMLIGPCLVATLVCAHEAVRFDGTFFAIAVGAYALMVVEPTARGRRAVLGRITDTQPLRFYADISLSVYLLHYPVLLLLIRHDLSGDPTALGALWTCVLVVAITTPLAWLTHRFVEVPARRWGRRRVTGG